MTLSPATLLRPGLLSFSGSPIIGYRNITTITVDFHGDQLIGIEDERRGVAVALKPIVEGMGLAWHGQFERLKRDPILAAAQRVIRIPSTGGPQEAVCLPVDLIPGFLFRIEASRIKKDDVREKVLTYQRECFRVLSDAFARPKRALADPAPACRWTPCSTTLPASW